jgi:hypothetical protein
MSKATIAAGTLLIAATSVAPLSAPASASAATTHCATRAEYHQVHHGQSRPEVAQILGHHGKIATNTNSGGYRDQVRDYPTCASNGLIAVDFDKNPGHRFTVHGKSAHFS